MKQLCLKMYLNGMGLRAIEQVTEIHHTTVMHSIWEVTVTLPNALEVEEIPEIAELDELQTFVGSKQKLVLTMDCCQPLATRDLSLGNWRPKCRNLRNIVAFYSKVAELLVCY